MFSTNLDAPFFAQDKESFDYILNPRERRVVKELDNAYRKKFTKQDPRSSPDNVYFLGDNPSFSKTWSCHSGKLPTFRRNMGFYYQRSTGKVMTSTDKLTALGWPTTKEVASSMLTSVLGTVDPKRAELMAGNAMHLSNVAIVVLVSLVCFTKKTPE